MTPFNFKGYFDVSSFKLNINDDIDFTKYNYIEVSSKDNQKKIFDFYKEEMQQGEKITVPNLGMEYIKESGFYDVYPKYRSWNKFKDFCRTIIYTFEIKDNIVWLYPIHFNMNNKIYQEEKERILKI